MSEMVERNTAPNAASAATETSSSVSFSCQPLRISSASSADAIIVALLTDEFGPECAAALVSALSTQSASVLTTPVLDQP